MPRIGNPCRRHLCTCVKGIRKKKKHYILNKLIPAEPISQWMLMSMRLALKQCNETLYCHRRKASCAKHFCTRAPLVLPTVHLAVPAWRTRMARVCSAKHRINFRGLFFVTEEHPVAHIQSLKLVSTEEQYVPSTRVSDPSWLDSCFRTQFAEHSSPML